jgi:hypothetical protein
LIAGAVAPSELIARPLPAIETGMSVAALESRTHTSGEALASGIALKSFALVTNATRLPSASSAGTPEESLPLGPFAPLRLTSFVVPAARSLR